MSVRQERPLRALALAAGLAIYGAFSQPAPPGLGPAELVVGLSMLAAVGPVAVLSFAGGGWLALKHLDRLDVLGCLAFVALVWVGLLRGLGMGWSGTDILRDVLPLCFLFYPVLARRQLEPGAVDVVAAGLACAGMALAGRWWWDTASAIAAAGAVPLVEGQRYLLNGSAVLFAAIWLPLRALWLVSEGRGVWRWPLAAAMAAGGFGCLLALAAAVYRASLGLGLLSLALGVVLWVLAKPVRLLFLLPLLALATVELGDNARGVAELVLRKTGAVGLNSREAEFAAVAALLADSPTTLLLGQGWGALFANPAVGGWRVSYTHAAPSYVLLKVGMLGLALVWLYLLGILQAAAGAARRRSDIVLAVLPPLVSGLLLHTSYKFLCFGICLLLPLLAAKKCGNHARGENQFTG